MKSFEIIFIDIKLHKLMQNNQKTMTRATVVHQKKRKYLAFIHVWWVQDRVFDVHVGDVEADGLVGVESDQRALVVGELLPLRIAGTRDHSVREGVDAEVAACGQGERVGGVGRNEAVLEVQVLGLLVAAGD